MGSTEWGGQVTRHGEVRCGGVIADSRRRWHGSRVWASLARLGIGVNPGSGSSLARVHRSGKDLVIVEWHAPSKLGRTRKIGRVSGPHVGRKINKGSSPRRVEAHDRFEE
jgi:hypothetical protein